jgi:hypothetical protein
MSCPKSTWSLDELNKFATILKTLTLFHNRNSLDEEKVNDHSSCDFCTWIIKVHVDIFMGKRFSLEHLESEYEIAALWAEEHTVCPICYEVNFLSSGHCSLHPICHICSYKMNTDFRLSHDVAKLRCAMCRKDAPDEYLDVLLRLA